MWRQEAATPSAHASSSTSALASGQRQPALFMWLQSKSKKERKLIVPLWQAHQTLQMNFNERQSCPAVTADSKVWL